MITKKIASISLFLLLSVPSFNLRAAHAASDAHADTAMSRLWSMRTLFERVLQSVNLNELQSDDDLARLYWGEAAPVALQDKLELYRAQRKRVFDIMESLTDTTLTPPQGAALLSFLNTIWDITQNPSSQSSPRKRLDALQESLDQFSPQLNRQPQQWHTLADSTVSPVSSDESEHLTAAQRRRAAWQNSGSRSLDQVVTAAYGSRGRTSTPNRRQLWHEEGDSSSSDDEEDDRPNTPPSQTSDAGFQGTAKDSRDSAAALWSSNEEEMDRQCLAKGQTTFYFERQPAHSISVTTPHDKAPDETQAEQTKGAERNRSNSMSIPLPSTWEILSHNFRNPFRSPALPGAFTYLTHVFSKSSRFSERTQHVLRILRSVGGIVTAGNTLRTAWEIGNPGKSKLFLSNKTQAMSQQTHTRRLSSSRQQAF